MTATSHLLCERSPGGFNGLRPLSKAHYISEAWPIAAQHDAKALIGGKVYFHDHKSTRSTFGGTVEWVCTSEKEYRDTKGRKHPRMTLIIRFDPSCVGLTWRGRMGQHPFGGVMTDKAWGAAA